MSVDAERMNVDAVSAPLIQPSALFRILKCPAGTSGGPLTDQDIVGHEALPAVDAPPDVPIDETGRDLIDRHRCPVLEAGDDLRAEAGLLADIAAAAGRYLDLIVVAHGRVVPALLAADNGRVEMPPAPTLAEVM